jgi:hypothetical protein
MEDKCHGRDVNGSDCDDRERPVAPTILMLLLLVCHCAEPRLLSDPALDNAFRP